MKKITIDDTIRLLQERKIQMAPCTIEEIKALESFYKVILPSEYKRFLLAMGKGASDFMIGSDCFYEHLFDLKTHANKLLAENNLPELSADVFVFWMHQGYQFCFLYLNEDNDPPIYYFNECYDFGITKIADSFSLFLYSFPRILELDKTTGK